MTDLKKAAQQALEAHDKRYQVVRDGYWWRVRIGDGTQTVGQHHTETGALRLASELHRAFHDGGFVVQEALRAALAQQEQEPVDAEAALRFALAQRDWAFKQLQAQPDRREWQGLTEEDMEDLLPLYSDPSANTEMLEFAAAIEAKLKEKNA
jgi:hypothetical protein